MHEPPNDVWVHPAARVSRSAIAGDGLFVAVAVAAGTPLIRVGGQVVTTARLHELFARAEVEGAYVDTIALGDDRHLVLPAGTLAHYGNHSCDPTMSRRGPYELVARHDLAAGTELTIDYGDISDDPSFAMACRCGAPNCRGTVTGRDRQRSAGPPDRR